MFKYFAMKRKIKRDELKVKAMLYGTVAYILEEQNDVIELIQKLYLVLKDVPMEELRSELIKQIALLAHEEGAKMREAEAKKSE